MTATPRFAYLPVLGHEIHLTEWGRRDAPPLVMWHGLARTGRDFDELAAALSERYFVICPDTIGRGLSSWSSAPESEYALSHYARIALALLDHYGFDRVGWIGTSMGGLIGLRLASGAAAARLRFLVINDIGPEVPQPAIDRILAYAGRLPSFADLQGAERWLREIYAPFGPAPEAFWQRMTRHSLRRRGDGQLTVHYDPRITLQFSATAHELDSWDRYDRITTPTHVIAGAKSDILPAPILAEMAARGPRPEVTLYDDCGHAPSLSRPQDAARLRAILGALEDQAGQ